MKLDNIKTLEGGFPEVFQRFPVDDWPDDLIVVTQDMQLDEDDLFPEPEPLADEPIDGDFWPPLSNGFIVTPDPEEIGEPFISPVSNVFGSVVSTNPWPGAPLTGGSGVNGLHAPVDCLAFYVPWHHFPGDLWGIYLVVEGVEWLGKWLHLATRRRLTLDESRYVAKTYLFHHEAFHNAVESFAARQEISLRAPVYKSGLRSMMGDFSLRQRHEEALAEAYAADKIRKNAFKKVRNLAIKAQKKALAFAAVCHFISTGPQPYSFAAPTLQKLETLKRLSHEFSEDAVARSVLPTPPLLPPQVWAASTHALHPTISRNKGFSYVVNSGHPLVTKRGLSVKYCSRRKFLQQVKAVVPGHEEPGGVHPIYVCHDNGKRVPIPTGSLASGTADVILKQLGLKSKYRNWKAFLAAEV